MIDEAIAVDTARKPWWQYWLSRLGLLASFAWALTTFSHHSQSTLSALELIGIFVMALIVANLFVFTFRYSVVGSMRRDRPPVTPPIFSCASRGTLGGLGSPIISYHLYPTGLEVWAPLIGRFFMPFGHIDRIEHSLFRTRYVLLHHSPEIRGAISVPTDLVRELGPYAKASWFPPRA